MIRARLRSASLTACAALILAGASATPSSATTFTVTKTPDTNVDCLPGDCSLREAIEAANAAGGADTVVVPPNTYTLTLGDLSVLDDLTINGAGASQTAIDGDNTYRYFSVPNATTLSISNLTLKRGRSQFGSAISTGGSQTILDGVVVTGNSSPPGMSGFGLIQLGAAGTQGLTIRNSVFSNNTVGGGNQSGFGGVVFSNPTGSNATLNVNVENSNVQGAQLGGGGVSGNAFGGAFSFDVLGTNNRVNISISRSTVGGNTLAPGGGSGFGGSIYIETIGATNSASVSISDSTLANNIVGPAGSGYGGAIHFEQLGGAIDLSVVNSTISGNSVSGGANSGYGGALSGGGTAARTITNSTITDNAIKGAGGTGGALNGANALTLKNSIVANNKGVGGVPNNCDTPVASSDHNIENADSCGFNAPGDQKNTNPLLGPLAGNGGPTQTQALLAGSPAINAGTNGGCPATDQRGGSRPQPPDGVCDVGAVEFGSLADLAVKISASPARLGQGDKLTYRITATNNGPDDAAGVKVIESLAAGVTAQTVKASQGGCAKGGVDCSLGTLAKGASATVDVATTPSRIQKSTSTARVSGNPTDPDPANNSATVTTDVLLGLSRVSIRPRAFTAASTAPLIAARRGATVRFNLFQKARVRFTVERPRRGRIVNGKCKTGGKGKGKRCTAYKRVKGSFAAKGKKGSNRKRFSGRLRGRKLAPGKYRLVAVARSGKNSSLAKRVNFKVARR